MSGIDPSLIATALAIEPTNFTDQMWGGDWISRFKGLPTSAGPVGESWEFSARAERPSYVVVGNRRVSILDLIAEHREKILGPTAPILVKFIDARDDLSLQVHPSDDNAGNATGKSEAWLIVDTGKAEGDSYIYLGFNPEKAAGYPNLEMFASAFFDALNQANSMGPSIDPQVRARAERLIVPFLNKIRVQPGEVYEIRPGVIHATGRGVQLFEVQQSSDTTYRVWDWNRPDAKQLKAGKNEFRELHLKPARNVMDFRPLPPNEFRPAPGADGMLIVEREKKFAAARISFQKVGEQSKVGVGNRYQVLTVIRGKVQVGDNMVLDQGHSAFVPACVGLVALKAVTSPAEIIRSYVPI